MNFWLKVSTLGALGLVLVGAGYLFLTRESSPAIICYSVDGGTRPRSRCIMNPFRDKSAEMMAESILTRLLEGDVRVLDPFLAGLDEDNRNHILKNETKYRITSCQIGETLSSETEISLLYWVTRENAGEDEVRFDIKKSGGEWVVTGYSAIY